MGRPVLRAAAGEAHSVVVVSDESMMEAVAAGVTRVSPSEEAAARQVFTFGRGREGQMGNGDTYAACTPQPVEVRRRLFHDFAH